MTTVSRERRVRFTVLERAHKLYRCGRCRRDLRTGEAAVSIIAPGLSVRFQHAGRACPPDPYPARRLIG